jgi:hypothetical protein
VTSLERAFDHLGLLGILALGESLWTPPSGHIFAMPVVQLEALEEIS